MSLADSPTQLVFAGFTVRLDGGGVHLATVPGFLTKTADDLEHRVVEARPELLELPLRYCFFGLVEQIGLDGVDVDVFSADAGAEFRIQSPRYRKVCRYCRRQMQLVVRNALFHAFWPLPSALKKRVGPQFRPKVECGGNQEASFAFSFPKFLSFFRPSQKIGARS